MKFRAENCNGRTIAIFDRELPPRNYLLAAFLEEARSTKGQIYLEIIEKIEYSKNMRNLKVTEVTDNCIDAELYTDRRVSCCASNLKVNFSTIIVERSGEPVSRFNLNA